MDQVAFSGERNELNLNPVWVVTEDTKPIRASQCVPQIEVAILKHYPCMDFLQENAMMKTGHITSGVSSHHHAFLPLALEAVNGKYWLEIKRILLAFKQNQAATREQAEYLVKLMTAMHSDLRDNPGFSFAWHRCQNVARGDSAWNKQNLLQDNEMYLELVTYFSDYPTPIHDYPDMATVHLTLSGRMSIEYYSAGHAALESSYPIAKLRRTETHTYGTLEASMCFPWQKNIQEIRALSERCIVLSAGLKASRQRENSWYLPISPQNTQNFFAQRLKRNE